MQTILGFRQDYHCVAALRALWVCEAAAKLIFLSAAGAQATAKPKNPGTANRNDTDSGSSIEAA